MKNHLGSINLVVDSSSGSIAQRIKYDAWGEMVENTNPSFQSFAFGGGVYDGDTHLTRFGFRDYDADAGTWMAKDPIRLAGGLNAYAYVGSQSTSQVDPDGLDWRRWARAAILAKSLLFPGKEVIKHVPKRPDAVRKVVRDAAKRKKGSCGGGGDPPGVDGDIGPDDVLLFLLPVPPFILNPFEEPEIQDWIRDVVPGANPGAAF